MVTSRVEGLRPRPRGRGYGVMSHRVWGYAPAPPAGARGCASSHTPRDRPRNREPSRLSYIRLRLAAANSTSLIA